MKYRKFKICLFATVVLPMWSFAANCPNGATSCYKKAKYERDIGTANESLQRRELNKIYVPDHHDVGVHLLDNGNVADVECIGLFANSFSDAVKGASSYIFLHFGLDDSVGWVDGSVNYSESARNPSSGSTRGKVSIYKDISTLDYDLWIMAFDELIGPKSGYYHLILFNCQDFASGLYN